MCPTTKQASNPGADEPPAVAESGVSFDDRLIAQVVLAEALIDGRAQEKSIRDVALDLFHALTAALPEPGEAEPRSSEVEFLKAVDEWLAR